MSLCIPSYTKTHTVNHAADAFTEVNLPLLPSNGIKGLSQHTTLLVFLFSDKYKLMISAAIEMIFYIVNYFLPKSDIIFLKGDSVVSIIHINELFGYSEHHSIIRIHMILLLIVTESAQMKYY